MKNKPVKSRKLNGIALSVWHNKSETGNEYETYSIVRSYKDSKGEWQNTNTLRKVDLVVTKYLIERELGEREQ